MVIGICKVGSGYLKHVYCCLGLLLVNIKAHAMKITNGKYSGPKTSLRSSTISNYTGAPPLDLLVVQDSSLSSVFYLNDWILPHMSQLRNTCFIVFITVRCCRFWFRSYPWNSYTFFSFIFNRSAYIYTFYNFK